MVEFIRTLKKTVIRIVTQIGRVSCSYTMGNPPVSGDNPRALASEKSYIQVDNHRITNLYDLHQF